MDAHPPDTAAYQASAWLGFRSAYRKVRTWLPQGNMLHPQVWAARHRIITRVALIQSLALGVFAAILGRGAVEVVLAVVVPGVPAMAGLLREVSRRVRMLSVVTSLMFASATLVDLTDGMTEAHFHFFVMLGVVSLYQDWSAFGLCVLITVVHHAVMGILQPDSVFAGASQRAHPVQWAAVHGAFILAASITHMVAWRFTEQVERRDPLTQLPNREAFTLRVAQALADRAGTVSVLFIDLDHFKAINDSGGHHVGDQALAHAATVMAAHVRSGDVVARLGGDEFAVLVLGDAAVAERAAGRIQQQLRRPLLTDRREIVVTASIGIADTALTGSRDPSALLRGADLAMYVAKANGRDRTVLYSAEVDAEVRQRSALATDLQHALDRGEFEVFYQPVVKGSDARLCGVEALLRWRHPEHGLVSPASFIPLAEESGHITEIGAWVLRSAAAQVAQWRAHIADCAQLQLAVNLSPIQLHDPSLQTVVIEALRAADLPASALVLEVTESMLLADPDLARRQLEVLRTLGAQVAIDDFGTGYSSLAYLTWLPVDQVKIDRSFVHNLSDGQTSSVALVRTIIDMAHALGLDVQAEGVEQTGQESILAGLGCTRSQGFLYSRPLSASDFSAFAQPESGPELAALAQPESVPELTGLAWEHAS